MELVKVFPNSIVDDIFRIHVLTLHGSCEEIIKGLFVNISIAQVLLKHLNVIKFNSYFNMSLVNMFTYSFSPLPTKLTILFRCEICWIIVRSSTRQYICPSIYTLSSRTHV